MKYKLTFVTNKEIRSKNIEADTRGEAEKKLFKIMRSKVMIYKTEVV